MIKGWLKQDAWIVYLNHTSFQSNILSVYVKD